MVNSPQLISTVLGLSSETKRVRDKKLLIVVSTYTLNSTMKYMATESKNGVHLGTHVLQKVQLLTPQSTKGHQGVSW